MASDCIISSFKTDKKAKHILFLLNGLMTGQVTKDTFKFALSGAMQKNEITAISEDAYRHLAVTKFIDSKHPNKDYSQYVKAGYVKTKAGMHFPGLISEHVVPTEILYTHLVDNYEKMSQIKIEKLLDFCNVALITKAEDKRLTAVGFGSKMPEKWSFKIGAPFARYEEVGIVLHKW